MKKIIYIGFFIVIIAAAVWFLFLKEPSPAKKIDTMTADKADMQKPVMSANEKNPATDKAAGPAFQPVQDEQDIQKIVNFLTDVNSNIGLAYNGTIGQLSGLTLPLSYFNTADYWGKYVCKIPRNDCTVTDYYYTDGSYWLIPIPPGGKNSTIGAKLQIERVDVNYGTNIYDAACWQIALALAAKNGLKGAGGQSLDSYPHNQTQLLQYGYDGNSPKADANVNRAFTKDDNTFRYNGIPIHKDTPYKAYFFRMITRNWLSVDPFMNTSYESFISVNGTLPPNYSKGMMTWMDWKPITGENAWAFLIGNLQSIYIQKVYSGLQNYVPFNSLEVQQAIEVLYAFRAMQSEIGAIYYATEKTLGNEGPIPPFEVSVENNASTLGGLMILKGILEQELKNEPNLSSSDKTEINEKLGYIDVMINGGTTIQGRTTQGLLAFFKNYAWDLNNQEFLQGGIANAPNKLSWQPNLEPKAVDVNTWSVSVLGAERIDQWFGPGSSYNVWQKVKSWGGYYGGAKSGEIWGVGYSDSDNNDVFSAEWTCGAINMVRSLIVYYSSIGKSDYVESLKADERSMLAKVMTLRTDNYPTVTNFYNRPPDWSSLVSLPADKLGFVYSQKRYHIPFGWWANPLPSTTSSSWPIMLYYNYNPFALNGTY
jgi:hypothetical protein